MYFPYYCIMYFPLVTLQAKYQNQLYKEINTGITIDGLNLDHKQWSKFRSQIINQTATNNLSFLIDPTFNNVNRLFVLSFPNEEDRKSISKYYTPTAK